MYPERKRVTDIDRTRANNCDDPSCKGWIHMDDSCGRGPSLERCDTCQQFPDDNTAAQAHDLECEHGAACEYRQAYDEILADLERA